MILKRMSPTITLFSDTYTGVSFEKKLFRHMNNGNNIHFYTPCITTNLFWIILNTSFFLELDRDRYRAVTKKYYKKRPNIKIYVLSKNNLARTFSQKRQRRNVENIISIEEITKCKLPNFQKDPASVFHKRIYHRT